MEAIHRGDIHIQRGDRHGRNITRGGNTRAHPREVLRGEYKLQMGALPARGNKGNDTSFLTDLRYRYPSIPISALKDTINNTLLSVNISKLSTDYSQGKSEKEKEADCETSDVKGMAHLLRAFLLYRTILIRITRLEVQQPLTFVLLEYCNRLLAVHYTLDSILKEFYFTSYNKRIATGVTDPMGWAQIDQYLVDLPLRKRKIIEHLRLAGVGFTLG